MGQILGAGLSCLSCLEESRFPIFENWVTSIWTPWTMKLEAGSHGIPLFSWGEIVVWRFVSRKM